MARIGRALDPEITTGVLPARRDIGALVFRGATLLLVALLLAGPGGVADLLALVTTAHLDATHGELHRWHSVDVAALVSVLLVGLLLVAGWRPRHAAAVVQTVIAVLLLLGTLALTTPKPGQALGPAATLVVLLVATFPERRRLLQVPHLQSRSGLAVAAAAAPTPFLLANAWHSIDRQLGGVDPHALLGHWAGGATLALGLLLAGWVAATTVPLAHGTAAVVAGSHLYLGVAAVVLPRYDGAWGWPGGLSSLLAALLFTASLRVPSLDAAAAP